MAKKETITATKYELTRLLGSRALQLASGAPILIKLTKKQLEAVNYNPIEIAKLELEQGALPITVKRNAPKVKEVEK